MQKRVEHKTTSRLYITTRQVRTNISLGLRARLSLMKMGKMIPFPHDWHVRNPHLRFPAFLLKESINLTGLFCHVWSMLYLDTLYVPKLLDNNSTPPSLPYKCILTLPPSSLGYRS